MTTNRKRANRGAGFTLVELLVVIVVIGLLAGISTTVLTGARQAARSSVVATQMAQLSMALDEYKNQFGEYPPDFSDKDAVMRHVKKRWPRYNVATYDEFMTHVEYGCKLSSGYVAAPLALADLDDPEYGGKHVWDLQNYMSSLVFWLGGLPDVDGKPSGFYANPKAPLGVGYNSSNVLVPLAKPMKARREASLFEFELKNVGKYLPDFAYDANSVLFYPVEDEDLQASEDAPMRYVPAFVQGDLPIVYFRPSAYSPYGAPDGSSSKKLYLADSDSVDSATVTRAVPYAREVGS